MSTTLFIPLQDNEGDVDVDSRRSTPVHEHYLSDEHSHSLSDSNSRSTPLNDACSPSLLQQQQQQQHSEPYTMISASANTAVMSNRKRIPDRDCASPPNCLDKCNGDDDHEHDHDHEAEQKEKRSIFDRLTKKKYNVRRKESKRQLSNNNKQQNGKHENTAKYYSPSNPTNAKALSTPPRTPLDSTVPQTPNDNSSRTSNDHYPPPIQTVGYQNDFIQTSALSPLTPAQGLSNNGGNGIGRYLPSRYLMNTNDHDADEDCIEEKDYAVQFDPKVTRYSSGDNNLLDQLKSQHHEYSSNSSNQHDDQQQHHHHHTQALLLSLAFFFIWSPQNLLAPNLTQAAYDFGYHDTQQRDLKLGSNLALATSILSLPFSALIGFASDVVSSRRVLISITTIVGGMAAIGTGMSSNYAQLILARFICGACMSGSVPVVFSLLSDWFDDKDRNAASSGFTAMMGAGILAGQVYAGCTGDTVGWRHSFYLSGILTIIFGIIVLICIREPIRGGKEKVLQDMIARGGKYDKKLSWSQFVSSMTKHSSNYLLMLQGFFCNVPLGVLFVFLNDFLSQEKGLSVPDATFIIAVFGVGCAAGGILGGFLGGLASNADKRLLPLFMALTTILGVLPFIALLDDPRYHHSSLRPCLYAFTGGCLASMPSVNVRPCIINVNPPEVRGAALTAANLIITAARGAGPTFLTTVLMGFFGLNRKGGFNVMIIGFWTITSIQLALLAKTLPKDQEKMETELANYAMTAGYGSVDGSGSIESSYFGDSTIAGDISLFSIENQASTFDVQAVRGGLQFMGDALSEIGENISVCGPLRRRPKQYTELFSE